MEEQIASPSRNGLGLESPNFDHADLHNEDQMSLPENPAQGEQTPRDEVSVDPGILVPTDLLSAEPVFSSDAVDPENSAVDFSTILATTPADLDGGEELPSFDLSASVGGSSPVGPTMETLSTAAASPTAQQSLSRYLRAHGIAHNPLKVLRMFDSEQVPYSVSPRIYNYLVELALRHHDLQAMDLLKTHLMDLTCRHLEDALHLSQDRNLDQDTHLEQARKQADTTNATPSTAPPADDDLNGGVDNHDFEDRPSSRQSGSVNSSPRRLEPNLVGPNLVGPNLVGPNLVGPNLVEPDPLARGMLKQHDGDVDRHDGDVDRHDSNRHDSNRHDSNRQWCSRESCSVQQKVTECGNRRRSPCLELKRLFFGPDCGVGRDWASGYGGRGCLGTSQILDCENPRLFTRLLRGRRELQKEVYGFEVDDCGVTGGGGVPFIPSLGSYGSLIRGFGSVTDLNSVCWLWNHMRVYSLHVPESVTYGCLFDALVQANEVRRALVAFRAMEQEGITKANTIMYSTLIKGFARVCCHDAAILLYEEMLRNGIQVNTVTYNSLVNACARAGEMKEAGKILEQMIGSDIQPDLVTFSTVVKGYCIRGEVERAYRLMHALKDKGVQPDGILYNTLLDGCVRYKKYALCEQVWEAMVADQVAPSNFTLTIFIKLFGKLGRVDKIFQLIQEFPEKYGFNVNGHVYTCVMSACINNQRFDCITPMFSKLLLLRNNDDSTTKTLTSRRGSNRRARERDASRRGVVPDAKSYETALTGLHRGKLFREGTEILALAFGLPNKLCQNPLDLASMQRPQLSRCTLSTWLEVLQRKRDFSFYKPDVEHALRTQLTNLPRHYR
ncbi:putative pentatricopeptide repeat protein [Gregarina niphandrodes]|uniref:Pentatricopeptide repeat protein n=1 Tax=Gregarina niphandrodes TaxID=110365 RepID=A0A023B8Y0_GRENI|nr:putative pentatricopeptide repeat protein [Gregarina niphandrodes]EZG70557.1 putative pentatricopeptide repeat protein [Gregarina niphandrodes]|eukprot:XP_011129914.1 putative pentatricopeptide repeat protein [Gregarina niphandrodes]